MILTQVTSLSDSARNLARLFRGKEIYLYAKHSDQENLAVWMGLSLHVLYHVNGYYYIHVWRLLLMSRVA